MSTTLNLNEKKRTKNLFEFNFKLHDLSTICIIFLFLRLCLSRDTQKWSYLRTIQIQWMIKIIEMCWISNTWTQTELKRLSIQCRSGRSLAQRYLSKGILWIPYTHAHTSVMTMLTLKYTRSMWTVSNLKCITINARNIMT